ncbi:MAG: CehA/McbA family metallohydrolase [Bryobacteraceae bacterium]
MGHRHPSRREILERIPLLGSGSLLLPAWGQRPDTSAPAIIRGAITGADGRGVAAKVRVVETGTGRAYFPANSIKTMPDRPDHPDVKRYFYAKDRYEVAVPPGRYRIEVVRGIAHAETIGFTEVGSGITHVADLRIAPLAGWNGAGWYSGNTHTHYHLQIDEDPDVRLRTVPPAEALDVSVISYLIRNDSPYITNRYKVGRLPEFSRDGTLMDMGEEARNNHTFEGFGYGHVLFLNIPRPIEPVSTGLLSAGAKVPDFPTLTMLCEQARGMGGTTVWCHNGSGVEVPVAAVLGQVDAYNVADGLDADYARYYGLLNCGLRIPVSSGTDWWIYDHNRVYVQTGGAFTYDSWIAGLRAGRTFVTNGPLVEFTVNGKGPGEVVTSDGRLTVRAKAVSRIRFDRVELIQDGEVIAEQSAQGGVVAMLEREVKVSRGGWLALRVVSSAKSHGGARVFAHTSPVYHRVPETGFRRASAAGAFVDEIEDSMRLIGKTYRFSSDADRAVALGRFRAGREAFLKIAAAG